MPPKQKQAVDSAVEKREEERSRADGSSGDQQYHPSTVGRRYQQHHSSTDGNWRDQ